MAVKVSQAVMDGLEAVRVSGKTNMFDYNTVMRLALEAEHYETVDWMTENKKAYIKGIFSGFEIEQ